MLPKVCISHKQIFIHTYMDIHTHICVYIYIYIFCSIIIYKHTHTNVSAFICVNTWLQTKIYVTGLKKDLKAAAQKDSTGMVADWSKAIINHMYWVASSTPQNTENWEDVVENKWKSAIEHVANIHRHNNSFYPRCEHPRRKRGEKKIKYMKSGGHSTIFTFLNSTYCRC